MDIIAPLVRGRSHTPALGATVSASIRFSASGRLTVE